MRKNAERERNEARCRRALAAAAASAAASASASHTAGCNVSVHSDVKGVDGDSSTDDDDDGHEPMLSDVDVVIGNPRSAERGASGPRMLRTVMQALPEQSPAAQLLTQGSRRIRQRNPKSRVCAEMAPVQADDDGDVDAATTDAAAIWNAGQSLVVAESTPPPLLSLSLLESIQNELMHIGRTECMNLTDAEKALIADKDTVLCKF